MKRVFILILFLAVACSTSETQSLQKRRLSSDEINCFKFYYEILGEVKTIDNVDELYSEFAKEVDLVAQNSKYTQTILSDGLIENQNKNRLILAILKRKHPYDSEKDIIEEFWRLFNKC